MNTSPSFFQKLSQTLLGPSTSNSSPPNPMSSSILPSPPASPQNRRNKRRKTRITTPSSIICVNCRAVNAYDSSMTSLFCDSCGATLVRGGRLMSGSTDDNDPTTAGLKDEKLPPFYSASTSTVQTPLASNRSSSSSGGLTITVPGSSTSKKAQDAMHSPTTSLFLGPSQPSTPSVPDDLLPNGRNTGQANSLISSSFREEAFIAHVMSLRLEPLLRQFRTLLQKLMNHSINKNMFNVPVDPVLLRLPDYHAVIKRPMDLGTIKTRLSSFLYPPLMQRDGNAFRDEVMLTFENAKRYNPPHHLVHQAADGLLKEFLTDYKKLTDPKKPSRHKCPTCEGATCGLCGQGCLKYDLPMIVCSGVCGMRIRKGSFFYVTTDGSMCWCQKCYAGLHSVLPAAESKARRRCEDVSDDESVTSVDPNASGDGTQVWYKRDLLKRKFDDEVAEGWVKCKGVNALLGNSSPSTNFTQPPPPPEPVCLTLPTTTTSTGNSIMQHLLTGPSEPPGLDKCECAWTLMSGRETPICLPTAKKTPPALPTTVSGVGPDGGAAKLTGTDGEPIQTDFTANSLPSTELSDFIQGKVRELVSESADIVGLSETITVREISTTKQTTVPSDTIKKNFNDVPSKVEYVSRSIMVFQRIDNVDISIFSMYVQEYEEDCQPKRVYLAYLDSVEYFRPRKIRSSVYHEVVVSYFAFCKLRGFNQIHIWSCPPSRGNNFIFWGHPAAQKTPNRQRLQSWYQNMIQRCVETGVCYNVHSLCDEFESFGKLPSSELPPCPAILSGDYWLDEASRIWKQHEKRSQSNKGNVRKSNHIIEDKSIDLACMLQSKIMGQNIAIPFLSPVDAEKLGILDYHAVIRHPMDLGTVHDSLMKHKYQKLCEANKDIRLVFSNAMLYNPPGHPIHLTAAKLQKMYEVELSRLCEKWQHELLGGRRAEAGELLVDFSDCSLQRNIMSVEVPQKKRKNQGSKSESAAPSRSTTPVPDAVVGALMMGPDYAATDPMKKGKKQGSQGDQKTKNGTHFLPLTVPNAVSLTTKSDKTRRSWLGVEVGKSLRKMRSEFFVVMLRPEEGLEDEEAVKVQKEKVATWEAYVGPKYREYAGPRKDGPASYYSGYPLTLLANPLVDLRHTFLELSQMRHLQFSTLRLAKYSSSILLYYLHRPHATSLAPSCDSCRGFIVKTRWHCAKDLGEINLCVQCYETVTKQNTKSVFTPFRITFNSGGRNERGGKGG
ncbi:hypothetical protein TrRE_jg1754, partial [Triparma retinervis]